jgi:iron complex transport system substrate-binding protein
VRELFEGAGGADIFDDRASAKSAKTASSLRTIIIAHDAEVIIGSWCGKKFRPEKVEARPGFAQLPAVENGALREIKSSLILQPGPAALTD